MGRFLAAMSLICLVGTAAAEVEKPNGLTPKDIATGWILLFDGETTFGWKTDKGWKAADGVLTPTDARPPRLVTTSAFGAFQLSLDYEVRAAEPKPVLRFGCDADGKAVPTRTVDVPLILDPKRPQPGWTHLTLTSRRKAPTRSEVDVRNEGHHRQRQVRTQTIGHQGTSPSKVMSPCATSASSRSEPSRSSTART